ncbi:MAG TPA: FAD-dependent oxidoreductase [Pyrinomonadaceae bacterium]|nr:FAD-dependent oxidoreductase [Pyrinomonadaceae bacterium]
MTSQTYDVIIVGAGIVGAACLDECARAGLRTAVVEAKLIGGGATAAGMGHLVVMDDSEAQFALTCYSQRLWQEMSAELPESVEYDSCGTIWVATDDIEMQEVRRKEEYYSSRGVPVEVLDARSLTDAEPNLRKELVGGLRIPGDSVIYPPAAARFLVQRARSRGAAAFVGSSVRSIDDGAIGLVDGTRLSASIVVNATGSWSSLLTPGINVKKRKGHLLITDRYPNFARHQLVELGYLKSAHSMTSESVAFNVQPRKTGQLLIGSSRQFGVETSEVEPSILARMLERAREYLPGLGKLSSVRAWTGFRAATPDKLPLIGPHPEVNKLYLATGHEGLGITTSLATARLLVDQIIKRDPVIPFAPYLPERTIQATVHG